MKRCDTRVFHVKTGTRWDSTSGLTWWDGTDRHFVVSAALFLWHFENELPRVSFPLVRMPRCVRAVSCRTQTWLTAHNASAVHTQLHQRSTLTVEIYMTGLSD